MKLRFRSVMVAGAALVALAACAQESESTQSPAADGEAATDAEEPATASDESSACPVLDSRNWTAWVNAMPGPDAKPTLHVTGDVDMPTPGYAFEWREGMADRSAMPVQRLMLTATPPDGMVAQVLTTETVSYEGPALTTTYGGVIVMCGGEPLAEITDVTVAQ